MLEKNETFFLPTDPTQNVGLERGNKVVFNLGLIMFFVCSALTNLLPTLVAE